MKFILIVVGIYFLLKYLFKAFFPVIVKKTFDKMQDQAKQQQQQQQQQQSKKEGEVTIEKPSGAAGTAHKKDVGDYVDFEEVDD